MNRRGSGVGIVLLVVVLVVVLLLVARQWKAVAPQAIQVTSDPDAGAAVDDHGEIGAGEELRSGKLPDLPEMQRETDAHVQRVQDALDQIE